MKGSQHSFSTRLSRNILIVTSSIFISVLLAADIASHIVVANEATKAAENLRDATIVKIENILQKVETSVASSAWLIRENLDNEEYLYHITQKIVEENPNIIGSAIAFDSYYFEDKLFFSPYSFMDTNSGEVQSKQLGTLQYNYFFMDWFQIPYLMGEPCWGEPYFDDGGADCLMSTYSYPLKDAEGKVFAVITADISLEWISGILSSIKPYPSSRVRLISRNGSFINQLSDANTRGETIFSISADTSSKSRNVHRLAEAISRGETGKIIYLKDGEASFAVFAPLSNGWKASISCNYTEVLSRTFRIHIILFSLVIIGLLILFKSSYLIIHKLTDPLSHFTESALEVAKGNFNVDLPQIKEDDEIKKLRDSFDYMQKSLKKYIGDLQETTATKERIQSELNIANQIQMAMLPRDFPATDRVGLLAMVHPAKEVGGDLYDFFLDKDSLYFAVGDVSGKGVPASLLMAITRASFRFIAKMGLPMNEVVSKMNNALAESNANGMFVTLFVGKINLETGEFKYCNAGHNPIVTISPDGKAEYMKAKPNLAAGLFSDFPYEEESCTLQHGSRLVIYTDGVTEAEKADKTQFGEDRLIEWSENRCTLFSDSGEACEDLYSTVKQFTDGNEQNDDITIMTIILR
ncbi:MAG: SpoIIE family protein phosphatase [Bacteroidales bacterium]|nr:SpoIIE family protein phosphatase [Candidatus Cacconaster scatequi]